MRPLRSGDPSTILPPTEDGATIETTAEVWTDLARSLYYRAADLQQQSLVLRQSWSGPAADLYFLMVASLIEGLIAIADLARLIAECLYSALEDPAYDVAAQSLPRAPEAAAPPPAGDVLSGEYARQPDPPARLFSGLYRNGLAAAQTALGGKFSGAVPQLVGTSTSSPAPVKPPVHVPPMMPMMPMMPLGMMGGMMGGDNGSGRPVPAWLAEPEPEVVFGVPLSNVDPVID